jgi:hypothetical protein
MATSGTYTFNLSIDELLEEACELAEVEIAEMGGVFARSAKRSFELIFADWANRGVRLWTLEQATISLVSGTQVYTIPTQYYEVLEVAVRENSQDTMLDRMDARKWISLSAKTAPGKPNSYYVERNTASVSLTVYPVPNTSGLSLLYYGLRYVQDSQQLALNADAPRRFYPALVAGIAIELVRKDKKMDRTKKAAILADLKPEYEERLLRAMEEDAERTSYNIIFARV